MTDKNILINFRGRIKIMLEFRGKPEHGLIRSGNGRDYVMTRRKLLHQSRVYHRWINYHDTKEGTFCNQKPPPPATTKQNILEYCFKISTFLLNFRHLNFTFLYVPCWILHNNKKFTVHVVYATPTILRTASYGVVSQMHRVLTVLLCL